MKTLLYALIIILLVILLQLIWKHIEQQYNIQPYEINPGDMMILFDEYNTIRERNVNNIHKQSAHRNRANEYYTHVYKNDAQNVHDTQVTYDLQEKYKRLDTLVSMPVIAANGIAEIDIPALVNEMVKLEIEKYINDMSLEESDVTKAMNTLRIIYNSKSNISSIVASDNVTEMCILSKVWLRIMEHDNEDDDMKNNLIALLIDANKLNISVCTRGRVARILSIFILLDKDEILSSAIKDSQTYNDEAYTKVSMMLSRMLKEHNLSTIFNKITLDATEQRKYNDFVRTFHQTIADELQKDYGNVMSEHSLNTLINNCQQGVELY